MELTNIILGPCRMPLSGILPPSFHLGVLSAAAFNTVYIRCYPSAPSVPATGSLVPHFSTSLHMALLWAGTPHSSPCSYWYSPGSQQLKYNEESVKRSQMDIKRKTCDMRTWKIRNIYFSTYPPPTLIHLSHRFTSASKPAAEKSLDCCLNQYRTSG
jgi:hypothetical protein